MKIVIKFGDKLTFDDITQIVEILEIDSSDRSKKTVDFEYISNKLANNPNGAYSVFAYGDIGLIGFMSYTGKLLDGAIVFELGDVIVRSEGRGKAVFFRMLRRFHKDYPNLSCYGTPNEAALPHEIKAGYTVATDYIDYRIGMCRWPLQAVLSKVSLGDLGGGLEKVLGFPLSIVKPMEEKNISYFASTQGASCMLDVPATQLLWRLSLQKEGYRYFCNADVFFIVRIFVSRGYCLGFVVLSSKHSHLDYYRLKSALKRVGVNFIVELSGERSRLKSLVSFRLRRVPFIYIGPYQNYEVVKFSALDGDNV